MKTLQQLQDLRLDPTDLLHWFEEQAPRWQKLIADALLANQQLVVLDRYPTAFCHTSPYVDFARMRLAALGYNADLGAQLGKTTSLVIKLN